MLHDSFALDLSCANNEDSRFQVQPSAECQMDYNIDNINMRNMVR